jgi:hypothetical protein
MAKLDLILSRRQALAGLSVIGAGAIPGVAASAKNSIALPSRTAWDHALAKFQRLHDEHEAACTAHGLVESRYYAERPNLHPGGELRIGDTIETFNERLRADRAEFDRIDADCARRTGHDVSEARQADACDASWEALSELLTTPAPGLAEVVQKIELATEYGRRIEDLEPVCADARRLLSNGRA